MSETADPIVAREIVDAGCAMGATAVTITITCATVPAARDLFRRLNVALAEGRLSLLLRQTEGAS